MGISKTDYMRGMQCKRMLWLDRAHPEERIVPPEVKERLDRGNDFGDSAMGIFGPFTEVTVRNEKGYLDYGKMIELTSLHINKGTEVICEASFSNYGNFCSIDILRKTEGGYGIYEVKNNKEAKEQFIKDTAFQRYIAEKCGIKVTGCYLVLASGDEENPFKVQDISAETIPYRDEVAKNIFGLGKVKYSKEEIMAEPGEQCSRPYRCWYYDYCRKNCGSV